MDALCQVSLKLPRGFGEDENEKKVCRQTGGRRTTVDQKSNSSFQV